MNSFIYSVFCQVYSFLDYRNKVYLSQQKNGKSSEATGQKPKLPGIVLSLDDPLLDDIR